MLTKLNDYTFYIVDPLSNSTGILEPRFRKDFISNADLLRDWVPLPVKIFDSTPKEEIYVKQKSFLDKLMDENSRSGSVDDEISVFMRSAARENLSIDVFSW